MSPTHLIMTNIEADDYVSGVSESTPLLRVSPSTVDLAIAEHDTRKPFFKAAWTELKWLLSSSSLTTMTSMLQATFIFVNVMSMGHLGAKELSAMAIAVSIFEIFIEAPVVGQASALETFCSTAYTAAHNKAMVGVHFQRGLFAMWSYLIMVLPFVWYTESIMLAIGQDPYIAKLSGLFLRITVLGMFPMAAYVAYERYLNSQEIMRVGTFILIVVAPLHWISNYLLVRAQVFGLGFAGGPIANIISDWLLIISAIVSVYIIGNTGTWGGWDLKSLRNMNEYIKLAIPAMLAICAEWISLESLSISSSYFHTNQAAGQAIMINVVALIARLNDGLGFGNSARVGNLIGAAKPRQAQIAGNVSIVVCLLLCFFGMIIISFHGKWWMLLYTSDPLIIREVEKLEAVGCLLVFNLGLNTVLNSILRGLGRQKISAITYIVNNNLVGIPLGLYLGFYCHMEVIGLWLGAGIGSMISNIILIVYIYMWIDWKDEVRLCMIRLQHNRGSPELEEPTTDM
ncbi:ethionine resistance protein [Coemansia sp. RSA 988]|nr:ethionine resistance protein [Coemansia sp. RSA 988]